ncbi:VCBS domain-containing protein, partial [Vibrio gelatinilyticus]
GLTFNADGSYTFDASSYDSLGKGEKLVLEIPVTVTDEHDATAQTTLTITVTGTNDAPVAKADSQTTNEDTVLKESVPEASDIDGRVKSYELESDLPEGKGELVFKPNGNYTFKPGEDFQALEPGQSQEVSFTYVAVDNDGAKSEPQTITITVTGTNDAPVAEAKTDSVTEDTVITGAMSATDVDLGDDAELSFSTDSTAEGLTFNADGSYTFDASSYDSLSKGDKLVLEIPVTVTDEHDAAAQTTLTITVTGTN